MASNTLKYFILTGEPGVGKTTLTKKLCALLNDNSIKTVGFYTEEVRQDRTRIGFDIVTLNGERARLARDQSLLTAPVKYKVGKYGVLIQEFEDVALPSIDKPDPESCIVIDEIGKMESFSNSFKTRVRDIFHPASHNIVLATIPIRKGDAVIESIRNNDKAKVWVISRENRNSIHKDIITDMKLTLNI